MTKKKVSSKYFINRRQAITASLAFGTLGVSRSASSAEVNQENLPPNLPEWTTYLGDGVDVNPYGVPSEFESHVVRRNVE